LFFLVIFADRNVSRNTDSAAMVRRSLEGDWDIGGGET